MNKETYDGDGSSAGAADERRVGTNESRRRVLYVSQLSAGRRLRATVVTGLGNSVRDGRLKVLSGVERRNWKAAPLITNNTRQRRALITRHLFSMNKDFSQRAEALSIRTGIAAVATMFTRRRPTGEGEARPYRIRKWEEETVRGSQKLKTKQVGEGGGRIAHPVAQHSVLPGRQFS
ncbi:hypothetical protein EVAR_5841_1 [Eumeta japonica]|uniref:Uncharacterized protein n=1 Tax=Eumeta variegata TaxID=151549 RepID=A0A4C1TD13_EUMVA|nr:hypothetical protein EVAR_5841_1 [Eumeta japonica]